MITRREVDIALKRWTLAEPVTLEDMATIQAELHKSFPGCKADVFRHREDPGAPVRVWVYLDSPHAVVTEIKVHTSIPAPPL